MGNEEKKGQKTVLRETPLVRGSVTRPPIRAANSQLAIVVLDVSPSMTGPKLDKAIEATKALRDVLAEPQNKDAFWLAEVIYADKADVRLKPTRATAVRSEDLVVKPNTLGGGTNITAGLASVLEIIEQAARNRNDWLRPVVVGLTDGQHNGKVAPDAVADEVKAVADLVGVAFGADADLALLRRLASKPELAFPCAGGADLRRFFQNVGASLSKSRATGQSIASILGAPPGSVMKG